MGPIYAGVDSRMFACPDRRIARVLDAVAGDLSKRVTLADAAAKAGLQREYFSRLFHRRTGMTFASWNARIRVDEAKRLLCVADLSVTAVAASVGYRDLTTFTRVFRRYTRMCPRQYRRTVLHGSETRKTRNAENMSMTAEGKATNAETTILERG
jgi:transcriptional regulator GlxA family with amidase domain